MTTITFTFFLALLASFLFTPFISKIARRFEIVDYPSERKVHKEPIPRIGGVAIFIAFFLPLLLLPFNKNMFSALVETDYRLIAFVTGAQLIFGLGLWDDIRRLPSSVKFVGQILVGIIVYIGGIRIHVISLPFVASLDLGYLSVPATVFWFVLVINAINLADGLDGLAAGIGLFVSLTMLVICLTNGRIQEAMGFAALGGSLLGFLKYNFNPASIFMGDCGSYFLGYVLAALSVLGSLKGQVATAMLIPVLALGIPLIDTLWAPLRRFIVGKKMFQPDSGHLHHRLVQLGYSQRRAVLIIYGITVLLSFAAIIIIHTKDDTAALILLVVGAGVIYLGRVVGLKPFVSSGKLGSWIHEVSDAGGLTHERRSFLNHQIAISNAKTNEELWQELCATLQALEIDFAELVLYTEPFVTAKDLPVEDVEEEISLVPDHYTCSSVTYTWKKNENIPNSTLNGRGMLKIEQPLLERNGETVTYYGLLVLVKDVHDAPASHYMLTRIEHLRRSINTALKQIHSSQPNEAFPPKEELPNLPTAN